MFKLEDITISATENDPTDAIVRIGLRFANVTDALHWLVQLQAGATMVAPTPQGEAQPVATAPAPGKKGKKGVDVAPTSTVQGSLAIAAPPAPQVAPDPIAAAGTPAPLPVTTTTVPGIPQSAAPTPAPAPAPAPVQAAPQPAPAAAVEGQLQAPPDLVSQPSFRGVVRWFYDNGFKTAPDIVAEVEKYRASVPSIQRLAPAGMADRVEKALEMQLAAEAN